VKFSALQRVSDYAYVLNKGEIVHQCPRDELVRNERIQAEYIGVSRYGDT
jgi:ABC-type branched-subunit amino acid transport system ATPase component